MRGSRASIGIALAATLTTGLLVTASEASVATPGTPETRSQAPSQTTGPARSHGNASRVIVEDVTIAVPGQPSIAAYVVRPAGRLRPHHSAGILFLHWLG